MVGLVFLVETWRSIPASVAEGKKKRKKPKKNNNNKDREELERETDSGLGGLEKLSGKVVVVEEDAEGTDGEQAALVPTPGRGGNRAQVLYSGWLPRQRRANDGGHGAAGLEAQEFSGPGLGGSTAGGAGRGAAAQG